MLARSLVQVERERRCGSCRKGGIGSDPRQQSPPSCLLSCPVLPFPIPPSPAQIANPTSLSAPAGGGRADMCRKALAFLPVSQQCIAQHIAGEHFMCFQQPAQAEPSLCQSLAHRGLGYRSKKIASVDNKTMGQTIHKICTQDVQTQEAKH